MARKNVDRLRLEGHLRKSRLSDADKAVINSLSDAEVEQLLDLYKQIEKDPKLRRLPAEVKDLFEKCWF